jgi:hypothetical protein
VLEHEHEQAVGRADGEQVEDTAVPAMTTERKTTVRSTKVRPSTSTKTYGVGSETESR